MNSETNCDDVLFFYVTDFRGTSLVRVIRHDWAAAMYPHFVDATGRIPEGPTVARNDDEVSFEIHRASSVSLPADLTSRLLGLHAQMLDYERLGQISWAEGYGDWLREWLKASADARAFLAGR